MSGFIIGITFFTHVAFPLGTAAWLAARAPSSKASRLLASIALAGYTAFIVWAGSGWAMMGMSTRWIVAALVLGGLAASARRLAGAPAWPRARRGWVVWSFSALGFLLGLAPWGCVAAASAAEDTAPSIDLRFPLQAGEYAVMHGGRSPVLNAHQRVRAQMYGLDLVGLGRLGFRASGLLPEQLASYEAYGRRVIAPCAGTVLAVVKDRPDQPPLRKDSNAPAGNAVLLHCALLDATVVLAHLKPGTVAVNPGDAVRASQLVAEVGNSGNTTEPHLHIHAVKGRVDGVRKALFEAEPVPLAFGGRELERNDVVVADASKAGEP